MKYLLDTVTIVRYFAQTGSLGLQARSILENNHHEFIISVISLAEIMYLSEKNRIAVDLHQTLELIEKTNNYTVIDLNPDILKIAVHLPFYELHDRLILATAKWLEIPILSSDKRFLNIDSISVIWN
ncbi:MAG: hypothetical protein RIT27_2485 [Pseudomonadota bacterium]